MSLERIKEEEAELEKEMFGEEDNQSEEDSIESEEEVISEPEATTVIHQENLDDTEASYKKRYANFKASADKTIYNLRKENSILITKINQAEQKIDELSSKISFMINSSKDPFAEVITKDDIDNIGEEAIDIVKRVAQKANEAAVVPLQEEVKRLKAERMETERKRREDAQKTAYRSFLADLGNLVPDYAAINIDSRFKEFMDGSDPITGERRVDAFRRAEDYLDAERVADFFKEFKRTMPKSKREVLEEKMTPVNSSAGAVNIDSKHKVETFTARQVEDFFNDIARGVYKNRQKEANEIEARITRAYMEGNIIG